MLLDYPVCDRQPEACAPLRPLGGEEGVEDLLERLVVHALAVVPDLHDYLSVLGAGLHRDHASAVVGHRLPGVHQEVDQHLLDLLGVAGQDGYRGVELEPDVGVLVDLVLHQPGRGFDDRVHVHGVDQEALVLPGEVSQPLDYSLDPLGTVGHVVDQGEDARPEEVVLEARYPEVGMLGVVVVDDGQHVFERLSEDLDVAPYELVRVVDLVPDAADELAQRRELVGLLQLPLVGLLEGDVAVELDDALDLLLAAEHGDGVDLQEPVAVGDVYRYGGLVLLDPGKAAVPAGRVTVEEHLVAFHPRGEAPAIRVDQVAVDVDEGDVVRYGLEHRPKLRGGLLPPLVDLLQVGVHPVELLLLVLELGGPRFDLALELGDLPRVAGLLLLLEDDLLAKLLPLEGEGEHAGYLAQHPLLLGEHVEVRSGVSDPYLTANLPVHQQPGRDGPAHGGRPVFDTLIDRVDDGLLGVEHALGEVVGQLREELGDGARHLDPLGHGVEAGQLLHPLVLVLLRDGGHRIDLRAEEEEDGPFRGIHES